MLGSMEVSTTVGKFLQRIKEEHPSVFVVVDPVMISTSGHKLITDDVKQVMISNVFPYADLITPNKFEAEELLGRPLHNFMDVEEGAKELLKYGCSVLIKGGHPPESSEQNVIKTYAQDYYLSEKEGVWLRVPKYNTENTHGTGCTLSSSIASAYAIGEYARQNNELYFSGANKAITALDACILAKAYVTAGIEAAVKLGDGPGPVAHTQFPTSHLPSLVLSPMKTSSLTFLPMKRKRRKECSHEVLGSILPVVDTIPWVERISTMKGITDLQFRIKNIPSQSERISLIQQAAEICSRNSIRLWINDYWQDVLQVLQTHAVFGIHLGQEDLQSCIHQNGLQQIHNANLALGLSTHSYAELAKSLNTDLIQRPSYISLGPIYDTTSKKVDFEAQGLETVRRWRGLVHEDIPLVVIGGINGVEDVRGVREAGADCVAVIGAVVRSDVPEDVVSQFLDVMES